MENLQAINQETLQMDDRAATVSVEAGKIQRLVNCVIDLTIIYIVSAVVEAIFKPFGNADITFENFDVLLLLKILLFKVILLKSFYYFLLEGFTGRTIGKILTKTLVVGRKGEKPSLHAIFIRTIYRLIPLEVFSFLGKSKRGWHDTFSKTRVIKK